MNGIADAQFKLGVMYDEGRGVLTDDSQAVIWYRKAAEQDDPKAQVNLGIMFANGEGVPKDETQALFWYRKAAEQGYTIGQILLATAYRNGEGAPLDEVEAYAWFNLASVSEKSARLDRDKIEKTLTGEGRRKAQVRTRELQKLIEERKAEKEKARK